MCVSHGEYSPTLDGVYMGNLEPKLNFVNFYLITFFFKFQKPKLSDPRENITRTSINCAGMSKNRKTAGLFIKQGSALPWKKSWGWPEFDHTIAHYSCTALLHWLVNSSRSGWQGELIGALSWCITYLYKYHLCCNCICKHCMLNLSQKEKYCLSWGGGS